MARTSSDIVIGAPAADIMSVIADFPAYPQWATGVRKAEVLAEADGRAQEVHFVLDAAPIRDEYNLAYVWEGDNGVSWKIVAPGTMLTGMDGSYQLEADGDGTRVTYQLEVNVSIPMLGMLKRKAEKVVIDTALKGLKRRVEDLRG
jgi:carbon monoxide dehydrogenase subunit G